MHPLLTNDSARTKTRETTRLAEDHFSCNLHYFGMSRKLKSVVHQAQYTHGLMNAFLCKVEKKISRITRGLSLRGVGIYIIIHLYCIYIYQENGYLVTTITAQMNKFMCIYTSTKNYNSMQKIAQVNKPEREIIFIYTVHVRKMANWLP